MAFTSTGCWACQNSASVSPEPRSASRSYTCVRAAPTTYPSIMTITETSSGSVRPIGLIRARTFSMPSRADGPRIGRDWLTSSSQVWRR
ncbi:hypothetical protein BZZ08_05769 [Streptomyces sp. MH60]|nr:hypothetical protein BZZ08_05769 [Streptomyces sp. MH60]